MVDPLAREDWVGRGGGSSELASKFGGGKLNTFPDGLPDDCARGLTPMPVPSEEGTIGLEPAGVNEDFDEISRIASNSDNSWVEVVPL